MSRIPDILHFMQLVKLGKRGQVSIPRALLRRLGIVGEQTLLVDTSADGAIVLRQAGVYPVEIYGKERLREFEAADRLTAGESARLKRKLKPRR
jgi:bifunctional DNA-binding transcriptional regulator/antitoxin component of YhaV-PrlF toxin-antitoxin module